MNVTYYLSLNVHSVHFRPQRYIIQYVSFYLSGNIRSIKTTKNAKFDICHKKYGHRLNMAAFLKAWNPSAFDLDQLIEHN
ncbi:hypothetical protein GCM10022289_43690 [Pedobacter jeongneungensis]|uniref:Uncharacterized protein n=1 Tax=Pedobacter jeongneungensis TaxID=947309 RepID=A0ABP8BPN0_9SPHI